MHVFEEFYIRVCELLYPIQYDILSRKKMRDPIEEMSDGGDAYAIHHSVSENSIAVSIRFFTDSDVA